MPNSPKPSGWPLALHVYLARMAVYGLPLHVIGNLPT